MQLRRARMLAPLALPASPASTASRQGTEFKVKLR
jgi:hypothetical protein